MFRNIARCASSVQQPSNPIDLYKYLYRMCKRLPKEAQGFYKHSIKQSFKQHVNESDPERIKEIMSRAMEDSKWIAKKYSIE